MRHGTARDAGVLSLGSVLVGFLLLSGGCGAAGPGEDAGAPARTPDFVLTREQTHTRFSRRIAPALRVPSGSIIEAFTHEATGGQVTPASTTADTANIDWDRVHTLSGPVHVEGAEPGDVLAVRLIELEPADWGWMENHPDFGFLTGEFRTRLFRTFAVDKAKNEVEFAPGIRIPLRPFAGVMGVAPDTDEMLNTIPPRANGGNLDDPHLVAGTTVYFPVFVAGALFSIGDTHAVQGLGEVSGTAMETPMRIVYEIGVIKGSVRSRSLSTKRPTTTRRPGLRRRSTRPRRRPRDT